MTIMPGASVAIWYRRSGAQEEPRWTSASHSNGKPAARSRDSRFMVEGNLRLKILPSISRTSKQTMQAPAAQEGMRTTVPKSSQGCGTTGTKWLKKRCLSSTRNPFERMRCVTREMQLNFNVLFAQVWAQDNKVPRTYDSGRWLLDKIWRCRQNSRRRALHRASLILKVPAWPISIRRRRPAIRPARIRNIIALALSAQRSSGLYLLFFSRFAPQAAMPPQLRVDSRAHARAGPGDLLLRHAERLLLL